LHPREVITSVNDIIFLRDTIASNVTHTAFIKGSFVQGNAVDLVDLTTGTIVTSTHIESASGSTVVTHDAISTAAYAAGTGGVGSLCLIKSGTLPAKKINMHDAPGYLYNDAATLYGSSIYSSPRRRRVTRGVNSVGKTFSVFLTNVCEYGVTARTDLVSSNFRIYDIGLGIIPSPADRNDDA
jgi:hypothetical protein